MLFTLEILQANQGDCLLLHYGTKADPKIIVIDGGPAGIYKGSLKPRLLEIKKKRSPDKPLPLSLVMVSHLDDDHVNGILKFTEDLLDKKENGEKQEFGFNNIWCNTFDDIIGNLEIKALSVLPAEAAAATTEVIQAVPALKNADHDLVAVITTTAQGRSLRKNANDLLAKVNNPFQELAKGMANLVRDGKGAIPWDDLKITVIDPNEQRLLDLQKKWDSDLKKAKASGDESVFVASLVKLDTSPFNLSSIVCLVELGGKTMLLTGDARCDDIVEGLKRNKLLNAKGKIHVDILKIPHHGSIRNMNAAFFQTVSADNYVISANGKYDNPDKGFLDLFVANVSKGKVWFTNEDGEKGLKTKMNNFKKKLTKAGSKVEVIFRPADGTIKIDLGDKINF